MIHCYEFYASLVILKPRYFKLFFHFPWDFEIAGFDCISSNITNFSSLSLILGMTSFKQSQPFFTVVSLIIFHCFQPIVSNHFTDFMRGFSAIFALCTVWLRVYKETTHIQGCALRKIEGSPVLWTCEIQCAQHMISVEKQRFSSHPRTKVRHHRSLGSARAQPWYCNLQNYSQKRSPVVPFL